MKVLLIIPKLKSTYLNLQYNPRSPHTGVGYLAGMLVKHGHLVSILDMRVQETNFELNRALEYYKPNLVGVTSTSFGFKQAYDIIAAIKEIGNFKVVIGGWHATALKKQVLLESPADLAITREGEKSILELCGNKELNEIDGLIWKRNGCLIENKQRELIASLDEIPFPKYELFQMHRYTDRLIPLLTSRGCPFNCIYCSVSSVLGHRFRARSSENVVNEIRYWVDKGYKYFQINDDCFSFDMKRAKEICGKIIKEKLSIKWDCSNGLRVDRVDEELLELMKKSGCSHIAFGIESADSEVSKNIGKGITVAQVKQVLTWTNRLGIKTVGFFMIGCPGDDFNKFTKTLRFVQTVALNEVRFASAIPYINTRLYDWVDKNGRWLMPKETYLNEANSYNDKPVFETNNFPVKERKLAQRMANRYVMKRIFQDKLGKFIGALVCFICCIPFLGKLIMSSAIKIYENFKYIIRKQ